MLTRVYVDNYRCFTNFEWRPGKLVLIGGLNGSGKSGLIGLVTAFGRLIDGTTELGDEFPDASLTRWEKRSEQRVELDVRHAGREYRYTLTLDRGGKKGQVRVVEERLFAGAQPLFTFKDGLAQVYGDDGTEGPSYGSSTTRLLLCAVPERGASSLLTALRDHLRESWSLSIVPQLMEAESSGGVESPDTLMQNFVSWYDEVSRDGVRLQSFHAALRPVFDRFEGLKLDKVGRDRWVLSVSLAKQSPDGRADRESRYSMDFDELSDGQRALIALYALLHFGPVDSGLLCLDEPDNYLALSEVEPWLKALEQKLDEGDGQVFLISHHPEAINRLWKSHGAWFERLDAGPVRVRTMNDTDGLTPAEMIARGWA